MTSSDNKWEKERDRELEGLGAAGTPRGGAGGALSRPLHLDGTVGALSGSGLEDIATIKPAVREMLKVFFKKNKTGHSQKHENTRMGKNSLVKPNIQ